MAYGAGEYDSSRRTDYGGYSNGYVSTFFALTRSLLSPEYITLAGILLRRKIFSWPAFSLCLTSESPHYLRAPKDLLMLFVIVMLAAATQMVTQTDTLLRTGTRMAPTAAAAVEALEDTEVAPLAAVTKCQTLVQD